MPLEGTPTTFYPVTSVSIQDMAPVEQALEGQVLVLILNYIKSIRLVLMHVSFSLILLLQNCRCFMLLMLMVTCVLQRDRWNIEARSIFFNWCMHTSGSSTTSHCTGWLVIFKYTNWCSENLCMPYSMGLYIFSIVDFAEGPCRSTLATLLQDYRLNFQYEGKIWC